MSRKQKQGHTENSPTDLLPAHITVVNPPSRFEKFKACLDTVATLVLFLTLVLSFWQFKVALRKEDEASTALRLARDAQQLSEKGLALIDTGKADLAAVAEKQRESAALAEVSFLTVRAENGDRAALERLHQLADTEHTNKEPFMISVADKNVRRILGIFSGETITDPWVSAEMRTPPLMGPSNVVRNLANPRYAGRAFAVSAIRELKLNDQIPRLIDQGVSDPDLHVVQVVCDVLNEMLSPVGLRQQLSVYDFVVTPEKTKTELMELWNANREQLLSVKPRYWQHIVTPDGRQFEQLVDPEVEPPPSPDAKTGAANEP